MKTLSHFPVDSLQSKAAEGEILAQVEIGVLKQIKPQLLLVLFTPAIQNECMNPNQQLLFVLVPKTECIFSLLCRLDK